jgi:hypothetical protein
MLLCRDCRDRAAVVGGLCHQCGLAFLAEPTPPPHPRRGGTGKPRQLGPPGARDVACVAIAAPDEPHDGGDR